MCTYVYSHIIILINNLNFKTTYILLEFEDISLLIYYEHWVHNKFAKLEKW